MVLIGQLLLIGLIGSILSVPLTLIFVQSSTRFKGNSLWKLIWVIDFIQIIVFILRLLILTVIPSIKCLKKRNFDVPQLKLKKLKNLDLDYY